MTKYSKNTDERLLRFLATVLSEQLEHGFLSESAANSIRATKADRHAVDTLQHTGFLERPRDGSYRYRVTCAGLYKLANASTKRSSPARRIVADLERLIGDEGLFAPLFPPSLDRRPTYSVRQTAQLLKCNEAEANLRCRYLAEAGAFSRWSEVGFAELGPDFDLCERCLNAERFSDLLAPELIEEQWARAQKWALDTDDWRAKPLHAAASQDSFDYEASEQEWNPQVPSYILLDDTQLGDMPHQVDVLVLVATEAEENAVLHLMRPPTPRRKLVKVHYREMTYYVGKLGAQTVALTRCEMGSVGRSASLQRAANAIRFWTPKAAIMVGIAFGLRPTKQKLGDILVSKTIAPYGPRRQNADGTITFRGDKPSSGATLHDRFRSSGGWKFERPDGRECSVISGEILTGEALIDDPTFRDELAAAFPNAIGGEMEGAGLYAAAEEAGIEWIVVKAICDWADGQKTNKYQPLAAAAATSFVQHVLRHRTALHGLEKPKAVSATTAPQEREQVAELASLFDRPAFYTPFHNESNMAGFREALDDVIRALATGVRLTREGIQLKPIASRRELRGKAQQTFAAIEKRVAYLRARFDDLVKTKAIRSCREQCGQPDCRVYFLSDSAVREIDDLRSEVLDLVRTAHPAFAVHIGWHRPPG